MVIILRGSDTHCQEYVQNKKQWLEKTMNQVLQGNESAEKIKTTDGIGNGNSFEVSFCKHQPARDTNPLT
jgi:hypothetical protein